MFRRGYFNYKRLSFDFFLHPKKQTLTPPSFLRQTKKQNFGADPPALQFSSPPLSPPHPQPPTPLV
jgi:hypothetical protein